jgi:flagellar hook-associated protein 1 FlgK
LIYQVNRIHSQGQGTQYFSEVTGTYAAEDSSQSMTLSEAGLDFVPNHGSFQLHVTQTSTGTRLTDQIIVDLDGVGGADMSLDDLAAAIDAVANVSASVTPDGALNITADSSDYRFSFSDDSSGVLAALGINTFFAGTDSSNVGINAVVSDNPKLLAGGQGHIAGDNRNALAISELQDEPVDQLGGISLREKWSRYTEDLAVKAQRATQDVESSNVIVDSLESQRQAVSGVSLDEEAINLLQYQRAYQGAARFLTVVDELMQTLLGIIS